MDSAEGWASDKARQSARSSNHPLLSNIYLYGLDWKMTPNGFEMVGYAEDFVVLCSSQEKNKPEGSAVE